jgi:abi family protein
MRSIKPYKTVQEHINDLRQRGMTIDTAQATQWLQSVGYYRLSGYWYPRRDQSSLGGNTFQPSTDFANVADLYEFDRKLRTLIHDALERVEIAMRNALVEQLGPSSPEAIYNPDFYAASTDKYYDVYFRYPK